MKLIKYALVLALTSISLFSCKENDTKNAEITTEKAAIVMAKPQTATMTIDGMMCPDGCAKVIEGKLGRLDGVAEAKVDYESKVATITFDGDVQNVENMTKMIEGIGDGTLYQVSNKSVTAL